MTQSPAQPPASPAAPSPPPGAASTGAGVPIAAPTTAAELTALRSRERAIREQLEQATDERGDLARSLQPPEEGPAPPPSVTSGIEARIAVIDARILRLEAERDAIDRAIAGAPAPLVAAQEVQGARMNDMRLSNAREEAFGFGLTAGVPIGLLLLLAWQGMRARRRARLGERTTPTMDTGRAPAELTAAVEAMAIEVERIGEGQRFLTQLLADDRARTHLPREGGPAA